MTSNPKLLIGKGEDRVDNGAARPSPNVTAQTVDDVQAQIDRIHSQMALYARDLKRMVDAEGQKARALAEANARLAILDRLKTDFLAFIAHELRTPLSEMTVLDILDPNDDPQALAEMIDILRRGYERLQQFIEKGLEYFRWLTAERSADQFVITDLVGIIQAVISNTAGLHDPDVALMRELSETPCLVRGEEEHLTRAVHVLLDNALKFSEGNKRILLRVRGENGRVELTVTDQGRGFAPEMGPELLRPFTIANVMHHSQGTGLSLALASAIITAYGGKISAKSAGLGQGATFVVELPEVSLL